MKSILMVVDNEFRSDPRVFNEAKILVNNGFHVLVLCLNFSNLPALEEKEGIKIKRIKISKRLKNYLFSSVNTIPFYDLFWAFQIKKAVKEFDPDFIHVHDLYMARSAKWANKKKKKLILDLHENYPAAVMSYNWAIKFPKRLFARPTRWQKKEYSFLKYANNIIVLSEEFRDSLLQKYPDLIKIDFVVYPNVPDISELYSYNVDTRILDAGDSFVLFYFGGIAERRGIFTCFEALKKLINNKLNVKLLIIGPVDRADLPLFNQYLSDTIIQSHIIYFPWKDISNLPSYVIKSSACLSPIIKNEQHESGVANKVFQYMLFERPVIVSDCKPQVSIIKKYDCGLVFKSGDADDLASKIEFLINHPEQSMVMGKNGKIAVINEYNIENYKLNLLNMYTSLAMKL